MRDPALTAEPVMGTAVTLIAVIVSSLQGRAVEDQVGKKGRGNQVGARKVAVKEAEGSSRVMEVVHTWVGVRFELGRAFREVLDILVTASEGYKVELDKARSSKSLEEVLASQEQLLIM